MDTAESPNDVVLVMSITVEGVPAGVTELVIKATVCWEVGNFPKNPRLDVDDAMRTVFAAAPVPTNTEAGLVPVATLNICVPAVAFPVSTLTVAFAALAPPAIFTTRAPVFTAFAILTDVAVTAVARTVSLVDDSVVAAIVFGVVFPIGGGLDKFRVRAEPSVAGLRYMLFSFDTAGVVVAVA